MKSQLSDATWVRQRACLVRNDCSTDAGSAVRSARPFRRGKVFRPRSMNRRAQSPGGGEVVLYGWHTVTAALANPERHIRKLWATENAARRLTDAGIKLTVTPEMVRPDAIAARLSPDAVHQGLLAEADPLPARELADLPAAGLVLALDQITDPHNVGAILRTAAAFAVGAVITTARYSPDATGVLAKSASGALEWVPMVAVTNLSRALDELKERAFQVIGLDGEAPEDLSALTLARPLALVLGAEGSGMRQKTRATCDRLARLNLPGEIKSLNVSNATAVALYIASKPPQP